MKNNTTTKTKEIKTKLAIAKTGHKHRIKEQKQIIKDAKTSIKMHKLLIKQAKTGAKLQLLEK